MVKRKDVERLSEKLWHRGCAGRCSTGQGTRHKRTVFVMCQYPPANTSRECPSCGTVSVDNRHGENFLCVACGYKADADFVGALNVLARTRRLLGSVESPRLTKQRNRRLFIA